MELTAAEKLLIDNYRTLSDHDREIISAYVEYLYFEALKKKCTEYKPKPKYTPPTSERKPPLEITRRQYSGQRR